jgi:hypothetical protein
MSLSAVTVDPTTFLNDLFAGVAGTPELLLAVPILAAVSLVSLLVYAMVGAQARGVTEAMCAKPSHGISHGFGEGSVKRQPSYKKDV